MKNQFKKYSSSIFIVTEISLVSLILLKTMDTQGFISEFIILMIFNLIMVISLLTFIQKS